MANYTDDFESHTPGSGLPTGWTSRWDTPTAWSVVDTSGDQSLKIEPTSNRCFASMDAIDSDADRDDAEILARLKTSSVSAGNAHAHLVLRGSGNSTSETGYVCGIIGDDLRIGKYVSATFTEISLSGQTLSANTYYWIRFRANSTSLKARIWADGGSEPGTWTIDTTDSSITGTGWAGCFSFLGGQNSQFSDVAVATNGDTASMSSSYSATFTAATFDWTPNVLSTTYDKQVELTKPTLTFTSNAFATAYDKAVELTAATLSFTTNALATTYDKTVELTAATLNFTANALEATYGAVHTLTTATLTFTANAVTTTYDKFVELTAATFRFAANALSVTLPGAAAALGRIVALLRRRRRL